MKKTYESMVLLDNREVRNGWEPLKEAVTGKFQKFGAQIISAKRWDERRLAYPIKGQSRGTYLLVYFEGDSESNGAITRELSLTEPVLRHVILSCDEVPADAHEPEAEFDASAVPTGDEPDAPEQASAADGDDSSDSDDSSDDDRSSAKRGSSDDDSSDDDASGENSSDDDSKEDSK